MEEGNDITVKVEDFHKPIKHRAMTEEEYQLFKRFKEEGNKHLESASNITICPWTDEFAKMIQLFGILTENLIFSKPFRIVVDYDPEQPRVSIHHYFKESDPQ